MKTQSVSQNENLLARLNRLPMTRTTIGILILLSLVSLAEAFDIGIVGPVLPVLSHAWHLTKNQTGLLGISSTVGVVAGMLPSGIMADKFGRRKVILFGILLFSILTLCGAFANGIDFVVSIRFLAGIGEGAILPMPYLYLSEFMQQGRRAIGVGYANGILTASYLIPNLAAAWAMHAFSVEFSWRIPFLLGGLPLLLLVPLYRWLPESPRFLMKANRQSEVTRLVEKIENEAHLPHDESLTNPRMMQGETCASLYKPTFRSIFRAPYLQRALMVSAQLTGALILFYILQVYGPTLLQAKGLGIGSAILFTAGMMGLGGIGSIVQGYLSDHYGRKRILFSYILLASAGCSVFALTNQFSMLLVAGTLTSFFGLGIFPVAKLCVAEQYPNELRGKGVFLTEMVARATSGCITLYFIPVILSAFGYRALFGGIVLVLIGLGLPYLVFGRETSNISVEEAGTPFSLEVIHQV